MGSTLAKGHGHSSHRKEGDRTNNSKNGNKKAGRGAFFFNGIIDLRGHRGIGKGNLELKGGRFGAISRRKFTKSAASSTKLHLEGSFNSYIGSTEVEQVNG